MTAEEKKQIYALLKTAADNLCTYSDPDFLEEPIFCDDETDSVPVSKTRGNAEQNVATTESTETVDSTAYTEPEPAIPSIGNAEPSAAFTAESTEEKLLAVSKKIAECTRCELCSSRINTVPGTGDLHPDVMVIGEAPGEEEDKQALPFVGPAGQLLDKMLSAIKLSRTSNCYIANTVKCRPPYNRDPSEPESEACRSYLDAQIHILKPKMILTVGKVALKNLLHIQGDFSLNKYRGQFFEYNGIPLLATYHPSALLRNVEFKKPAWEDLKLFRMRLTELSPDYATRFKEK